MVTASTSIVTNVVNTFRQDKQEELVKEIENKTKEQEELLIEVENTRKELEELQDLQQFTNAEIKLKDDNIKQLKQVMKNL